MMKTAALLLLAVAGIAAQNEDDRDIIDDIFGRPNVTSTTVAGAPIFQGGDGMGNGNCICVPYYDCDANYVLKNDGETDGFGTIDIRFGKNKCSHFMDRCCTQPEGPGNQEPPEFTGAPPVTPTVPPATPAPTLPPKEVVKCGIRNPKGIEFSITGNLHNEAEYGEFPWMAAILKTNWDPSSKDNLAICGGSLIHPQVVLTAAHCVVGLNPSDIKVRLGEWDTQTTKERYPYQEQNVKEIITHKEHNKDVLWNDVALLVLSAPVNYAANIKPICLPSQNYVFDQKECYASGWGKKIFGIEGSPSVILKKIDLPIVPRKKCEDALRTTRLGKYFNLHESFICAGGIAGKDTCTGDGGSPLVCPDKTNPGRYTQAGIVAWGIGCGEDKIPGVYGDVARFRSWVDQKMNQLGFGTSSYTE